MYDANEALSTAFAATQTALSGAALSENDQSALADYASAFAGAQKMIDENAYNGTVRDFTDKTLEAFPASVLAPVFGVEAPKTYN